MGSLLQIVCGFALQEDFFCYNLSMVNLIGGTRRRFFRYDATIAQSVCYNLCVILLRKSPAKSILLQ
jgi:hypothetical protein